MYYVSDEDLHEVVECASVLWAGSSLMALVLVRLTASGARVAPLEIVLSQQRAVQSSVEEQGKTKRPNHRVTWHDTSTPSPLTRSIDGVEQDTPISYPLSQAMEQDSIVQQLH